MHEQMTKAHDKEIKVIEESQVEILNLKRSFHAKIIDLREKSQARISWLWDEL